MSRVNFADMGPVGISGNVPKSRFVCCGNEARVFASQPSASERCSAALD